jgi:hypothetical protein
MLAVIPASVVALALIPGGLMILNHGLDVQDWGANGPMLIWPVWGVALGVATLAHHLRRRGACRRCGLDDDVTGANAPQLEAHRCGPAETSPTLSSTRD